MAGRAAGSPSQSDWVHIGARDLLQLREDYIGRGRSRNSVRPGRGGSLGVAGMTVGVTARDKAQDLTESDDAEHVLDYLGADVYELEGGVEFGTEFPPFVVGSDFPFGVSYVGAPSGLVPQMAYLTHVHALLDGKPTDGALILIGAAFHSRYGPKMRNSSGWTPSTPEGLMYAFHIARGAPPEEFSPWAAHDLTGEARQHLCADLLSVAANCQYHPAMLERCDFTARIHGVLYAEDGPGRFYPGVPKMPMPRFLAYGAPLTIKRVAPSVKGSGHVDVVGDLNPLGRTPRSRPDDR